MYFCHQIHVSYRHILLTTGFMLAVPVVHTVDRAKGETPVPIREETAQFAGILQQFQALVSIEFGADVEQKSIVCSRADRRLDCLAQESGRTAANDSPVRGRYEFRAFGERYMIRSYLEPRGKSGLSNTVAYDGTEFQLLLGESGTLSYSEADPASLLPVLPNPLLELIHLYLPISDDNAGREFHLRDFQTLELPAWVWDAEWKKVEVDGRRMLRAVFPGGTYNGQPYWHHVYVMKGKANMPVRMDRVAEDGTMTSTEFSDYRRADTRAGAAYWPWKIVMKAFRPDGKEVGWISYKLTHLAVDPELGLEAFTIQPDLAKRIWDSDRSEFVEK